MSAPAPWTLPLCGSIPPSGRYRRRARSSSRLHQPGTPRFLSSVYASGLFSASFHRTLRIFSLGFSSLLPNNPLLQLDIAVLVVLLIIIVVFIIVRFIIIPGIPLFTRDAELLHIVLREIS